MHRLGKKWKEALDKDKDYNLVEDGTGYSEIKTFFPSAISFREYEAIQELKQNLLAKYEGKTLEDVIGGQILETQMGSCFHITSQNRVNFQPITPNITKSNLLSDLKLLYGIREKTETRLKSKGYTTIEDLLPHPRFGNEAAICLEIINKGNSSQLMAFLAQRFPKSHPLMLCVSGLHAKEDFLIVDVESLGLFMRPIILFGVAQLVGDQIIINQYFLRDISEEPAALLGFLSHVSENAAFVSFNGRIFDIPYIKERLAYYGMMGNLENPHFDLLHFSRRAWREDLPNCRLGTIETHLLGIEREDDVPGALVPEFYTKYLQTQNVGPVIPIIEHNKQDLVSLIHIFSRLAEKWELF